MSASSRRYFTNTGVNVEWEYRSLQAFADAPLDQLTKDYDLLVIDHPHIPLASAQGLFAQLDGSGFDDELTLLAAQSVGPSHVSYAHNGHQYALASDAAAQVAAYRPDLLTDPPMEWGAVFELARAGRVLWPAKPIDAYSSFLTLAAAGGTPVNADTGRFLSEDDALPILEKMHLLAAHVPESSFAANPIDVAEALSTTDTWLYSPLLFGYTNYSRAGFRPYRLKYVDMPSNGKGVEGSLLGGAGIAVSSSASDVEAARAFAFWVASAGTQSGVYYDAGGQPGNATAWEDDRLNSHTLDFFTGTRTTLEGAYVRPRCSRYIEFQDLASPWVTQALQGDLSDQQLITRLNDAAARLLVEN
ncbi:extracellular solute-binding protein [Arthrobacter tecti]